MCGRSTAIALVVVATTSVLLAADWPQWRGPNRDGKSQDTGLLRQWPEGGPVLAWRADNLGGGYSAPAVAGGRVFGMSNRGNQEVVWALSEKDGTPLWVTALGPAFKQVSSQGAEGPACTPTVDGDRLYVEGLAGNVACLQVQDGKIIWQVQMTEQFGARRPMWSFRESPLVDGDKVVCTPGSPDAMLVALDKMTGKTIWKTQMPGGSDGPGAAYASPIAIEIEGQRLYVQLTANTLIGVAASDGRFLWRYDRPANRNGTNCATPVFHDGAVFASSAYGAGGGAVRLTKDPNGLIQAKEVYFTRAMQNHHGGMILVDGYLYGASGGNEGGALVCLEFGTGKVMWDLRSQGQRRAKGSLAYADGLLYYRMEDGTLVLIRPNPKQYTEINRFQQPNRTNVAAWTHPVIANGRLYVRDQGLLLCYNIKAD
ncbi:MAG: PQQ-like beta-propeller repeat protein [Sedimentisphaerales bacterium]|nr:PQQ-like beta-propeller repeat protein [Sedimentisphaerales bacterium]